MIPKTLSLKSRWILREFMRGNFWRWEKGISYALIILAVGI